MTTLAQARPTIRRFIHEAKGCAYVEFGFAAMLTIFRVILAVGESITPGATSFEILLWMADHLYDHRWLMPPRDEIFTKDMTVRMARVLLETVDALGTLCLPSVDGHDVTLTNTWAEAKGPWREKFPDHYIISTTDFISAVERVIYDLIEQYPDRPFPVRRAFGPANRDKILWKEA